MDPINIFSVMGFSFRLFKTKLTHLQWDTFYYLFLKLEILQNVLYIMQNSKCCLGYIEYLFKLP